MCFLFVLVFADTRINQKKSGNESSNQWVVKSRFARSRGAWVCLGFVILGRARARVDVVIEERAVLPLLWRILLRH